MLVRVELITGVSKEMFMITWMLFGALIISIISLILFIKTYYDEKYESEKYQFRRKRVINKKIDFKR